MGGGRAAFGWGGEKKRPRPTTLVLCAQWDAAFLPPSYLAAARALRASWRGASCVSIMLASLQLFRPTKSPTGPGPTKPNCTGLDQIQQRNARRPGIQFKPIVGPAKSGRPARIGLRVTCEWSSVPAHSVPFAARPIPLAPLPAGLLPPVRSRPVQSSPVRALRSAGLVTRNKMKTVRKRPPSEKGRRARITKRAALISSGDWPAPSAIVVPVGLFGPAGRSLLAAPGLVV